MQDFITHNEYLTGNRANSLINRKMIFRILGILLFIEGGLFLLCAGVSLCYQEHSYIYFLYSTLLAVMQKISFLVVMATVLLHLHGFYLLRLECFLSTSVAKYLLLPMLSLKRCQGLQPQVQRFWMILSHCRMECFSGVAFLSGLEV